MNAELESGGPNTNALMVSFLSYAVVLVMNMSGCRILKWMME